MHAEYIILNDCSNRQKVKQIGELLPDLRRTILTLTFRVETVDLRDLSRFMVAS